MTNGKTLLFYITEDWYFWSHRLHLARAARDAGYKVIVVVRVGEYARRIEAEGFTVRSSGLSRQSKNPFSELLTIWRTYRLYREVKPDIVHHVAIKPILYGSIAARFAGVPATVNALAGLGYIFTSQQRLARMIRAVITPVLSKLFNLPGSALVLQNRDNEQVLISLRVVDSSHATLIRGSGVDTREYSFTDEVAGEPMILLAGRMLWDKGIGELVSAARILKSRGVPARVVLVGPTDPANPMSIPESQLKTWQDSGFVEWWGRREDIAAILLKSTVACLPSYSEGLPKFLLEAAAAGRAIVTTDVPGCREVVSHLKTGMLVPVQDPDSLANALQRLLQDPALRRSLRENARRQVEAEFSSTKVIDQTLSLYQQLLLRSEKSPRYRDG